MPKFEIVSDFQPTGDQPEAIKQLVEGIDSGYRYQTLRGATGTGKTYTMAQVIEAKQRPTLVISSTVNSANSSQTTPFLILSATTIIISQRHMYPGMTSISKKRRTLTKRSTG